MCWVAFVAILGCMQPVGVGCAQKSIKKTMDMISPEVLHYPSYKYILIDPR